MSGNKKDTFYRARVKRILDVTVILCTLPLIVPVLVLVTIAVRLGLGSPVFFSQWRLGHGGQAFRIRKFRTMTDERDAQGNLLPDSHRLTPFGRILRRTSLDELPELLNVLRGEMSLVGPRPLLMRYLPYFSEVEQRRFSVRPGITGWAQVNGRNDLPWDERLACDVWYVGRISPWLDVKIMLLTVIKVLRRENIQVVPKMVLPDLDEARRGLKREHFHVVPTMVLADLGKTRARSPLTAGD